MENVRPVTIYNMAKLTRYQIIGWLTHAHFSMIINPQLITLTHGVPEGTFSTSKPPQPPQNSGQTFRRFCI
jgi:hypothetical protein